MIGDIQTMKNIDQDSIFKLGIPGIVLMETAARKLLNHVLSHDVENVVIVCGVGNNGGDGFALGRLLSIENKNVKIYLIGQVERMSGDCKTNYDICQAMAIPIEVLALNGELASFMIDIKKADILIDSILGTGADRPVSDFLSQIIELINNNCKNILSVDVPSGLNSDTGKPLGKSIVANKTVTFQLMKRGFLNYEADKYTGEVVVENIGIPESILRLNKTDEYILDERFVKNQLKPRDKYSHKGTYGHVLLVGGSKGYEGAICLSAMACCKAGAGTTTMCVGAEIEDIVKLKVLEAMVITYKEEDKILELLNKSKAIAIGPGMGKNHVTFKIVRDLIRTSDVPIVLDADGINVLVNNLSVLNECKSKIILTPHPGEFARLMGKTIEDINENRIDYAKKFAKENNVIMVLKGYRTVITDGEKAYVNTSGSSAMASGGMGDSLTGIIASMISQNKDPLISTCIAVFLHGYCGDMLAKEKFSIQATDLIDYIPKAMKDLCSNN